MAIQLGGLSFMQQTSPVSGREVPRHSSALLEAIMTAPCNGCPPVIMTTDGPRRAWARIPGCGRRNGRLSHV
jgi:hypothetical protein